MRQKKGRRRTSWPWVPLEKMKRVWRENERIREFERMRKLKGVRKRENREVFVEKKKEKKKKERRVMRNVKR